MKSAWQYRWQTLTSSPGRTLGVGLLVLLGVGLWTPSVRKWQSRPDSGIARTSASTASQSATLTADAHLWTKLDKALMRPPAPATQTRNPFRAVIDHQPVTGLLADEASAEAPIDEPSPVIETALAAPVDVTGLTLRSTFLSRERRGALINGRLLYEGQTFAWQGVRFRVAAVEPQCVRLEGGGQLVELRLAKLLADELFARQ